MHSIDSDDVFVSGEGTAAAHLIARDRQHQLFILHVVPKLLDAWEEVTEEAEKGGVRAKRAWEA